MGLVFSFFKNYTYCHNCDTIANLRCCIKSNNKDYPNQLKNYYRSTLYNGDYVHRFVACEKCIDPSVFKLFTYHPNGWKEDIKYYVDYEEAKF